MEQLKELKGDVSTMYHNKWVSLLMKSLAILIVIATMAIWPRSMQAANSTITFVNLSNSTAYLARYDYQPYRPARSSAGDLKSLVAEQPEGWRFRGWVRIDAGESVSFNANQVRHFYVTSSNGQLTWPNLKESPGYVRNGKAFDAFVSKKNWTSDAHRLITVEGYTGVKFQEFTPGRWIISGNAYRIEKKQFPFDISSRSPHFGSRTFQAPGNVVDYAYSSEYWRAKNVSWKQNATSVELMAYVSGTQKRLGGPVEPGYYRGTVTVHYTVRN